MASRGELKKEKEKTSQALIQSALKLCEEEGYASLSLRSVARKAGIAPTSFYRHFREIDEMGVEMVAQAKDILDEFIATAQKKMTFPAVKQTESLAQLLKSIQCIAAPFVDSFFEIFKTQRQLLHLFFQERTGSSEAMRKAISDATNHLTGLLGNTLNQLIATSGYAAGDMHLVSETMITIVSCSAMEMLARPEIKQSEMSKRAIQKLNLLLLGAMMEQFDSILHSKQMPS